MNFAQKFLYPINIMPTDRQVGVSRFSFKTSAGAACCGRDGMVDIPDLKSGGRMPVRVQVPPPAPKLSIFISVLLGNFGKNERLGFMVSQLQKVSSVDLYFICQMVDGVTRKPCEYLRNFEDIFW